MTFSKKIILLATIAATSVAISSMSGDMLHAASAYDNVVYNKNIPMTVENCKTPASDYSCDGTTGDKTLKVANIYSTYQTKLNAATSGTCKDAKDYFLANYSDSNYYEIATRYNMGYRSGYYSTPAAIQQKLVMWHIGKAGSRNAVFSTPAAHIKQLKATMNGSISGYRIEFNTDHLVYPDYNMSCTQLTTGNVNDYNVLASQRVDSDPHADGRYTYLNLWAKNISITYPLGYEGKSINTNYVAPTPEYDDIPNIQLQGVNNFKGTFNDTNFLTFDEYPFLCGDDTAPIIEGKLLKGPTVLNTFTQSATALYTVQFDNTGTDEDYKIEANYICPDESIVFTEKQEYNFTITAYGTLEMAGIFDGCITGTVPYVDVDECIEGIYNVFKILTFNKVININTWVAPGSCYTLQTLDDWINKPGMNVCPAVPSAVRTVVTPFILFYLGLQMVRAIDTWQGD